MPMLLVVLFKFCIPTVAFVCRSHKHNVSPLQYSLADVMSEVPHLVKTISPDGWAALLGCSRQWRQLVHEHTSTMFLTDAAHVATVAKGIWPRLSLMVLCNQHRKAGISWKFEHGNLQLLAQLNLSTEELDCTALLVRPKADEPFPDAGQLFPQCLVQQQIISAFDYLATPTWQQLTHCTVANLPSFAKHKILAHLASTSWPAMTYLDLSNVSLAPRDVAHLVKALWPRLKHLDLQKCEISNAALQHLASTTWPELETLCLSENQLDDEAAAHLVETSPWPNLNALWLDNNAFTAAGVTQLMQTNWPGMKELRVDNKMLLGGLLDSLTMNLDNACLDGAVLKISRYSSIAGKWPDLQAVDVVLCSSQFRRIEKTARRVWDDMRWTGLACFAGYLALYR